MEEEIARAFESYMKGIIKDYASIGTVMQVNESEGTCDVQPIKSDAPLLGVRYVITEGTAGINLKPKQGSTVVVARERNSSNNMYIAMFGEVDAVEINGNTHGGLVIYDKLKAELNKEKQRLSALIQAIQAAPVTPADGGAAFKAGIVGAISALVPANFDNNNILNDKVKHG